MSSLKQYNQDLLKLLQKYSTDQELLNLSKSLERRATNLATQNIDFREAKSSLTVRTIKGGK